MPAFIAAKACSSGTGVGFQVINMSPCCGRQARVAMSKYGKESPGPVNWVSMTYRDFADNNVRGRPAESSCGSCHGMLDSVIERFVQR